MTDAVVSGALARLVRWKDYRASRANFYPSDASYEHRLRRHRARLVEAGALVLLRGQWWVDPEAHDREEMQIAREEAQAWISRQGKAAA